MLKRKPGDPCLFKGKETKIYKVVRDHGSNTEYYELEDGTKANEADLTDPEPPKKKK